MGRPALTLVVTALLSTALILSAAPTSHAGTVTRTDRESTYPPEIHNITHAPWQPSAGQDLVVEMTLSPDAEMPDGASLLYCRVEPEYTCALPSLMEPTSDERVWVGTIEWEPRFMKPETVHVGYNITLRYEDPDVVGGFQRIPAPTGNHWLPETFPEDSDGVYYFVAFARDGQTEQSPSPPLPLVLVLVLLIGACARRRVLW